MQRENREFNASGDIAGSSATQHGHCFAKSAARRHIILKERLTAGRERGRSMAGAGFDRRKPYGNSMAHGIFEADSAEPLDPPRNDILFDGPAHRARFTRESARPH